MGFFPLFGAFEGEKGNIDIEKGTKRGKCTGGKEGKGTRTAWSPNRDLSVENMFAVDEDLALGHWFSVPFFLSFLFYVFCFFFLAVVFGVRVSERIEERCVA